MNLNNIKFFHPICIIKLNQIYKINQKIKKNIPKEWLFIILNNGSFTQNLNSLLVNKTTIEMSQKYQLLNDKFHNIRIVWLENYINNNLTFAQSIWAINKKNHIYKSILNKHPIGNGLIELEVDIYKNLQEIYCGYSYDLENTFQNTQLIWGRKYKIYYTDNSYVTIEEFFTPKLIDFFNITK